MDTDTDQTSESTTTPTAPEAPAPTPSETPAPSTSEAPKEESGSEETKIIPNDQVPSYKADYKLKVYDEEKELDDPFLKSLIKDADSEKKVKEIAQKYLGFDTVKGRHEKLKTEFQQYQQAVTPVVQHYNEASRLLQKGDLEGFFELTNIPTQEIFKYAVQKAEEANLDPQQRMQLQQQRQISKQKEYLESQNMTLQQQQQQQQAQFRAQELSWVLSRPDVHSVASAFDAKVGRPGAFRQAVIDKGLAHYAATQGDLSAEEATAEVMKLIGAVVNQTTQAPTPGVMPAQQAPLIQQNGQPPIIPNVSGRGSSPVKKQVRSLADIKKRREELGSRSS